MAVPCSAESILDRDVLATGLVMEAASEGPARMHALINVIQNLAPNDNDPDRYMATVLNKGEQFSSFNKIKQGKQNLDNLVKMAQGDYRWEIAIVITKEAYRKRLRYITFGADHFASEPTYWSKGMVITIRIGDFTFYRSRKR